jgi:hypothetical protein
MRGATRGRSSGSPRAGVAGLVTVLLCIGGCARGDSGRNELALTIEGELEAPPEGPLWAPIDVVAAGDRIFVLDIGAGRIYAHDPRGGHRISFGGAGAGPGELAQPSALGVSGDTLWVLNTGNRRIEKYAVAGGLLASIPLPDTLPPPIDLARLGSAWFMTTAFPPGPVVRFELERGVSRAFGAELEQTARRLAPRVGVVPDVYRLDVLDGRLWVFHLYLPLAGVYDRNGRFERLVTFPGSEVRAEDPVEEELGEGRMRRIVRAPRVATGALGILHLGRNRYLLTRQQSGHRQLMFRLVPDGVSGRPVLAPPGTFFLASAERGGKSYVAGTKGEDGEPAVFIVSTP